MLINSQQPNKESVYKYYGSVAEKNQILMKEHVRDLPFWVSTGQCSCHRFDLVLFLVMDKGFNSNFL